MLFKKKEKPMIDSETGCEVKNVWKPELGMVVPEPMKKHNPEEEERMHEEELKRRLEAMDEKELKILAQYIPCDLLIDRLRSELIEKMEWKIKIDEMYNRFHNV